MRSSRKRAGVLTTLALVLMLGATLATAGSASAQRRTSARANPAPSVPGKRTKDAARHSSDAARALTGVMRVPDKAIPKELLDGAEAVAVFPGVLKAAFIVGGRKGQGVVSRRIPATGEWSAPAFFNVGGGSFGPQIGGTKTDFVLLIMNEEGLKGLLEDKFEIGGEAGVAAGPVGRTAGASTNVTLDAGILTYSRSKGAFIGASLKGVAITPDNDLNEAFYGKKASDVLSQTIRPSSIPSSVRAFPLALSRFSAARKTTASR